MRAAALALGVVAAGAVLAEPDATARCLACHLTADGQIDIVGLEALTSLPPEWPLYFEDAFDLDGDGIAGRVQHVSGNGNPMIALYGRKLAAARLQDFATIAGAAHDIDLTTPGAMQRVLDGFLDHSPDPQTPPDDVLARFEARGCGACHVTDAFKHKGRDYQPLSDFLLHDLGYGPVRTAPLWGCLDCLSAPGHPESLIAGE